MRDEIPMNIQQTSLSDSEAISLLINYHNLRTSGLTRLQAFNDLGCDSEGQKFILQLIQYEFTILDEEGIL